MKENSTITELRPKSSSLTKGRAQLTPTYLVGTKMVYLGYMIDDNIFDMLDCSHGITQGQV